MPAKGKKSTAAAKVSSPSDFKKKSGGTFELPSGGYMKLKNPGGMRAFLTGGVIPNSLMVIIQEAIDKGTQPDMSKIITPDGVDQQMVADMMELMDNIIVTCSVEPKVHPVPENEDDRDDDLLYADELDETDKMFVFQWATGGTSDLERFRQELAADMDSLRGSEALGSASKSTAGA